MIQIVSTVFITFGIACLVIIFVDCFIGDYYD